MLAFRNGEAPQLRRDLAHATTRTSWSSGIRTCWSSPRCAPKGPQKTLNVVEFYYPEEIALFEREFVEAEQAAYMETCVEDDEIALRMDAGRKALMERGDDEVGPYQSPMEDGMQHFHEWYRTQMFRPLTFSGCIPIRELGRGIAALNSRKETRIPPPTFPP